MFLKEQLYVTTLCDEGTITAAAEKLYITQPALSIFITKLEKQIGKPLFERRGGILVPTYLGEKYLEAAREMLRLQDQYNLAQSLIVKDSSGRMRIGIQTRRSPEIIPMIISRFSENYPNIDLCFEESNTNVLEKLLDTNKIDLMISSVARFKEDLHYVEAYDERLLITLPAGHHALREDLTNLSKYPFVNLKDVAGERFILPHHGQSLREDIDIILAQQKIVPKVIQEIRSLETITKLVAMKLGIGFIRESYIKNLHVEGVTYGVFELPANFSSKLVVASHKASAESPQFLKLMQDLANLLASGQ